MPRIIPLAKNLTAPTQPVEPPSQLAITIRRGFVLGRFYLLISIAYLVFFGVVLSSDTGDAYAAGTALFLPMFGVIGAMGGLMVFTGDRMKGVYEYLLCYGVSPRRLFVNVLVTTLVLASVVLGISLPIGLGVYIFRGNTISTVYVIFIGLYALPMSYASAAFAAMVGMFWTSLSSPRQGINNPITVILLIGMAPSIITLAIASTVGALYGAPYILLVTSVSVVLVVAAVFLLLSQVGRLLPRERLLSAV
jgi:hypothetical protein